MKSVTSGAGYATRESQGVAAKARLYVPNPKLSSMPACKERVVICSPHFDDAVLSCWSILARDRNSTVVNVFSGAPPTDFTYWYDQLNGASSSATHMQHRCDEDRSALSVVDKSPIDLGMLERQYRLRPSPWLHKLFRHASLLRFAMLRLPFLNSALYAVEPPDLNQMADAILRAVPDATCIWVPAGIGGHTDHILVRQAGLLLAARGLKVRLYADIPYVLRFGWPAWLGAGGEHRPMDRASAYWASYFNGGIKPESVTKQARIVHLTPAERLHKSEAIRRYVTQFESVGAGRMRGWLRHEDALKYEVYWEINSSPTLLDLNIAHNSLDSKLSARP